MKNSKIKQLSDCQIEAEIEVSKEEFGRFIEKAKHEAAKKLEIKGFRKGRAPEGFVKEIVDEKDILVEAANLLIQDEYQKLVKDNDLEVIDQPKIDIIKMAPDNPFVFRLKATILPKINLPDYAGLAKEIKRKEVAVDEKEIKDALLWLQKSRAKLVVKNEPAKKGDFIEIEYFSPELKKITGRDKNEDAFILGEGKFIPGFEEKLEHVKSGEEKEFSLVIPKEHFLSQKINSGKLNFKVKIKNVYNMELPEINDSFARMVGKFENLSVLSESIKHGILEEKKQKETERVRTEIIDKISRCSNFEIPKILIEREKEQLMDNIKKELNDSKTNWADYLKRIAKDEKEAEKKIEEMAKERIKKFLILREIGKRENFSASDEEIREKTNEILKNYPLKKGTEKDIDFNRLKEYSREIIINEKIFKLLDSLVES